MSASGRGGERLAKDQYPTQPWCVERLLEVLPVETESKAWLEPCAGSGTIIQEVNRLLLVNDLPQPEWTAIELDDKYQAELSAIRKPVDVIIDDFLRATEETTEKVFDVTISNPPYSLAMEFVERCLRISHLTAMLLRVGFLESETRADWIREHTPDVYILPNRPSFAHGRTDNCAYAWMVWGQPRSRGTLRVLDSTPRNVRVRKRTDP